MEKIINAYYADNAKMLHSTVDKILSKFGGLSDKDRDDFYSLANEVFVEVLRSYNGNQSFDSFLYLCLTNRIKTEITKRNREKRKLDRLSVSIDMPIGDDEDCTIADIIPDSFDTHNEAFKEKEDGYSQKMLCYLSRLSGLQRDILKMTGTGYSPNEIRRTLHITNKQYADSCAAIHSYRNISVLF